MKGLLLSVHTTQLPIPTRHSANEDHPPLYLYTSRAGLSVKSWRRCCWADWVVSLFILLCIQRGEMHGDTHA